MKISAAALAAHLTRELPAAAVSAEPAAVSDYSVDGNIPALVCHAATAEEVSLVLRLCGEADAAIVPWGGGTLMSLGNIPRRVDVVLKLEKLSRLIEHDDANLTATAEAGMTADAFQGALAERGQFLPVDPPRPERATLGGVAAANISGPRRALYGGVRDLVIGMKIVLAGGERVKSGGKVVKNVAGYDLAKLFIGSLGTLGVITEMTFRVSPRPEAEASFAATGPLAGCVSFVKEISGSALLPTAVTLDRAAGDSRECRAVARIEGFDEAIARHLTDLGAMAERWGLTAHTLRGDAHRRLWQELCDFGWGEKGLLCRVVVPLGSVENSIAALAAVSETGECLGYIAHPGSGTIWALLEERPTALQAYAWLGAIARDCRGHIVLAAAPSPMKERIDVWGDPPKTLAIMREIKRQFDPASTLNPGRFIGRL
jgi:glycolate oxidase FAD binding subunit